MISSVYNYSVNTIAETARSITTRSSAIDVQAFNSCTPASRL
ncbi:MAG: hypothetical protein QXQ90_08670 [Desulfurococcaceae archaeon]